MSDTAESLIGYCQNNKRICPEPKFWNQLWEMLPSCKQQGAGWQPPLPLILGAWHDTPAMLKMLRLAEHIQWAKKHNRLEPVADFLRGLGEEDWFHVGE